MSFGQKFGVTFGVCFSLFILYCRVGYADESQAVPVVAGAAAGVGAVGAEVPPTEPIPLAAANANWIFSGSVSSENGDRYNYFFQAKRKQNKLQATVSLVDAQTKAVLFMQTADSELVDLQSAQWTIGDIFLRYNTINHSWIFGLKKANQTGFNFKVDTLKQSEHAPQTKQVRKGVVMTIVQTGQVNGHIQLKETGAAQFVSGKNAWFREVIMEKTSQKTPTMHGLLCHFQDGSGLYSMQVMDKEIKHHPTYAGSYNTAGVAAAVSKTVKVDQLNSGLWQVKVPHPKLQFAFNDLLQNQSVIMGVIDPKQKAGFCVISKDEDIG